MSTETKTYPSPSLATDMVVFTIAEVAQENYRKLTEKKLEVLLVKRKDDPFQGAWALPGGFVNEGETVGQAARRELLEETGAKDAYVEQLYTFSAPDRDPRGWVVSAAHMALAPRNSVKIKPGDDAAEVSWFSLKYNEQSVTGTDRKAATEVQLTLTNESEKLFAAIRIKDGEEPTITKNDGLAFDHAKIIGSAILRLKNKIEYTDVAFELMPRNFTLTELQQVYELILNRQLLAAAFRRKIAERVEKTGGIVGDAGHRPSALFRKKATPRKRR